MPRKYNPNSLENLKPFEAGNNANPTGRPKGSVSLVSILEKVLQREVQLTDPLSKEKCTKEVQEWVVMSLLTKAMKGDISAIKEVLERVDGKVAQKNELTGKDGEPIKHENKLSIEAIDDRISSMFEKTD